MVSALHRAGIEVILDVVYNHTGEGGHEGPTLAFRGLDHLGYYRLTDDQRNDYDVTGCGNSVDTSEPGVLRMVLDSLRYWVTEMGVDGFRFDLVSTLLRDERHHVDQDHPFKIAIRERSGAQQGEDDRRAVGHGSVRLPGRGLRTGLERVERPVPQPRPRLLARQHPRRLRAGPAAVRVTGHLRPRRPVAHAPASTSSPPTTASPCATWSPTTSSTTAPTANRNRDGTDDNRSWNCGVEGETDDAAVNALRHRQTRNLMATLILAAGVPMITAGDELGRTQQGNNNAYCQDSPISWVHWDTATTWADQTELTRRLLQLRAEHPVLPARALPARRDAARRGGQADRPEEPGLVRRLADRDVAGGLAATAPGGRWASISPATTRTGPTTTPS